MSFFVSLSGLKAAQTDLSTISNNVANVSSTGFKKSIAQFGDIYAGQSAGPGQGVRLQQIQQQFTQGTLDTTDKTLDLAIAGEGFFTVRQPAPSNETSYTRAGGFGVDENRYVVDATGARLQVFRDSDGDGTPDGTTASDLTDLVIPDSYTNTATPPQTYPLSTIAISNKGVVSATFADGTVQSLGTVAMANFTTPEHLSQTGDAHWLATKASGPVEYGTGNDGSFGAVRSGMLERSNVDITAELVSLISAQRNFQANAKAIETDNQMNDAITNLRT
jgi:flagellar hook protein FlgE